MNRTALSSFASTFALTALAWSALGCGSTVIGGGGEGGGDIEPGCEVEDGCVPPPGVSDDGVAVRWATLGGDIVGAPDGTLLLAFGSEAASCANPLESAPSCGPELAWKAEIPLPVEYQYAGAVVDLESLVEVGYGPFYSGSQGEAEGACSGGGGTLLGTLEVIAIDASTVTVRLSDTLGFGDEVDGTRTLLRCDGGTEPVVGPAVALTQEQLDAYYGSLPDDGGGSSGTTGGGPAPDDRFFVFIDALGTTGGLSCNDPYAYSEECQVERRIVTLSLDPNQLVPGVYPIGPGGAGLTFSESGSNGDGSCWGGGGGGFDEGTVEIVAIDDSSIRVIVQSSFLDGSIDATASRCP